MFASLSKLHFLRYLHFDGALARTMSMLRMDGKMGASHQRIAVLPRACGAPWLSKSAHPRRFCNDATA